MIEEAINRLAAAIEAQTELLSKVNISAPAPAPKKKRAPREKAPEPEVAPEPEPEVAPEPEPEVTPEPEPTPEPEAADDITHDTIAEIVRGKYAEADDRTVPQQKFAAIRKDFGIEKLSLLPADKLPAMLEAVKAM